MNRLDRIKASKGKGNMFLEGYSQSVLKKDRAAFFAFYYIELAEPSLSRI